MQTTALRRTKGMSLAAHCVLGSELCTMRNTLLRMSVSLGNTYRVDRGRPVIRIYKAIDRLRCRLDSQVFKEYPTQPHLPRIYYPEADDVRKDPLTLSNICPVLASMGHKLERVADLLLRHYPVKFGDAALKIARQLAYQSVELPYTVGAPKRPYHTDRGTASTERESWISI